MSILRNLAPPAEQRAATLSEALLALREGRTGGRGYETPLLISAESSLRHSAVWSSVNLIADLISTLPLDEFRKTSGRPVKEEDPSPLLTGPNDLLDADAVWRQSLISKLLRGNGWGLITERDDLLYPLKTEILHPDEVHVRRKGKLGQLEVRWNGVTLSPDEYWRTTGYTFPGSPIGLSPITYVAETIGLGKVAQQFAADWFADGGHPSAILTNEKKTTAEGAQKVKNVFKAATSGNREPAVMGDGWRYEAIQINPEESQFLDTIKANRAVIATIFGLRPEDVGESSGDSQTYANVEQRQISRLVYPIGQWVIRLENALTKLLRPGRFAKFNVDALVRVDLANRYRAHDSAIRAGWKNRNEIRELEDLKPIDADDEGDAYLWPPYRAFPLETDEGAASAT
jgi:HK97 family phage portal protein